MALQGTTASHSGPAMQSVTVDQALALMHNSVSALDQQELLASKQALGRVLARDILAPTAVPAQDNAAMDGYAFHGSELDSPEPATTSITLRVCGTALAGRPWAGKTGPGECVRIMTGASMPTGCDTVIPHERTSVALTPPLRQGVEQPAVDTRHSIHFERNALRAGDNCRLRGEDLSQGQLALPRGSVLRPAHLGLLASLGLGEVLVRRRLRVAFFSTGDELRLAGETLDPGCIYDSNRQALSAMLERLGCETIDMGVVADDAAALEAAMAMACRQADVLISSGGVAAGDADHTREVVARMAGQSAHFWQVAMRPGRPLAFATISSDGHSTTLFGLPGNPVAAMMSFYFLVRPVLQQMMGALPAALPIARVPAGEAIRKAPGRTEYLRAQVFTDARGNQQAMPCGAQGSGILRSMCEANCIIILRQHQGPVAVGDLVDLVYLEGLA